MKYFKPLCIASVLLMLTTSQVWSQLPAVVSSPDDRIKVHIQLEDQKPFYAVQLDGVVFLENSPLGLKTSIGDFSEGLSFAAQSTTAIAKTYELKKAKVSHVEYQANELIVKFINTNQDTLAVQFRVSNADVAFA